MPLVRYLPNRALTIMENIVFQTRMAEFHSGYMLYSRTMLERVPFEHLQNNYNFDAEMILIFNKHFRQPGDPNPKTVDVSSEEFYGVGYEDCDRRIPNVDKARNLLGWKSEHDLDSVLFLTMKYFVDKHRAKHKEPVAA